MACVGGGGGGGAGRLPVPHPSGSVHAFVDTLHQRLITNLCLPSCEKARFKMNNLSFFIFCFHSLARLCFEKKKNLVGKKKSYMYVL